MISLQFHLSRPLVAAVAVIAAGLCGLNACDSKPAAPATQVSGQVVLYTSIDEPYVRPLVKRFEQTTGIRVTLVTDSEATKTAGLIEKLQAERDRPRADVYWGNEIFHTINLAESGLFAPYRSPVAEDVPARWRDPADRYTDIGLRARVIAISTRPDIAAQVRSIRSLLDLTDPKFKGRLAICHPGFGTASGHVAALYTVWGEQKADDFFRKLRDNDIKLLGGNSVVAEQVAAGVLWAGPTDNDDVAIGKAENQPIDGIVPDQGPDGIGTLLMPTTIALVAGAANPIAGKKLIDFLVAPAVERELIDRRYLGYSVRDSEKHVKAMDVDYPKVAAAMPHAVERSLAILQHRRGVR